MATNYESNPSDEMAPYDGILPNVDGIFNTLAVYLLFTEIRTHKKRFNIEQHGTRI